MILVVDDDMDIRSAISEFLDALGYANQTAQNGQEALDLLSSRTIPRGLA